LHRHRHSIALKLVIRASAGLCSSSNVDGGSIKKEKKENRDDHCTEEDSDDDQSFVCIFRELGFLSATTAIQSHENTFQSREAVYLLSDYSSSLYDTCTNQVMKMKTLSLFNDTSSTITGTVRQGRSISPSDCSDEDTQEAIHTSSLLDVSSFDCPVSESEFCEWLIRCVHATQLKEVKSDLLYNDFYRYLCESFEPYAARESAMVALVEQIHT